MEAWGNLACQSMAGLILFNQEGLGLVNRPVKNIDLGLIYRDFLTIGQESSIMEDYWDIRINSLNILMARDYTIEERLILLGIFYDHLDSLISLSREDLVQEKMDDLIRMFSGKSYQVLFKRIGKNSYLNLGLVKYLMDLQGLRSMDKLTISLNGYNKRLDFHDLETIYDENKGHYEGFMEENSHILENYLINNFLLEGLPRLRDRSLRSAYMELVVDFLIYKLLLIANGVYSGRLNQSLVLERTVDYSQFKIDNPGFVTMVMEYFRENKLESMEALSLILKN